jgi:hypothetical protein
VLVELPMHRRDNTPEPNLLGGAGRQRSILVCRLVDSSARVRRLSIRQTEWVHPVDGNAPQGVTRGRVEMLPPVQKGNIRWKSTALARDCTPTLPEMCVVAAAKGLGETPLGPHIPIT